MKIHSLFLAALLLFSLALPVYAHEKTPPANGHPNPAQSNGANAKHDSTVSAGHNGNVSMHDKINQLLKSAPGHNLFIIAPDSKTHYDFLLDIRGKELFQKSPLKNAQNIPLADLHDHLKDLPREQRVLVYGSTDIDAAYAVFVLRLHGVNGWLVKASVQGKHK
jgi:rhodanese-related sulfurtransferase